MKSVLLAIALAACGGSRPPPPPPVSNTAPPQPVDAAVDAAPGTDAFARMRQFTDDMCKCADSACADRISARMTKWGAEMAAANNEAAQARMSEADMKQMATLTERMARCMTVLYTNGTGSGSTP